MAASPSTPRTWRSSPTPLSSTTHAWEAPAIVHVAALICTMTTLRMCSMECLARVDEAHEAATTTRLEPVVDLIQQEVEQLAHVQATTSTLTSTPSTGEDIPPVVVVIDVDPKASVQEQDASPLPSINTTTPVASEMDHNTSLFVSSNLIVLSPTKCSTKYHIHAGRGVIAVDVVSIQGFIVHECRLSFNHNAYFNRVSIGDDYYYLNPDRFYELVQVHLNHGCYHGIYNNLSMIKDLEAPWDPHNLFIIAAWAKLHLKKEECHEPMYTWPCNL
ncbi:LON peptidase N-terminal domain and RING finger protein 1 [Hordeum vulgare]|nr:LON peptidase N-terminal domain and RING finger protein 1 [Hordeum vulgare]